jgi:hypothetical protein
MDAECILPLSLGSNSIPGVLRDDVTRPADQDPRLSCYRGMYVARRRGRGKGGRKEREEGKGRRNESFHSRLGRMRARDRDHINLLFYQYSRSFSD